MRVEVVGFGAHGGDLDEEVGFGEEVRVGALLVVQHLIGGSCY